MSIWTIQLVYCSNKYISETKIIIWFLLISVQAQNYSNISKPLSMLLTLHRDTYPRHVSRFPDINIKSYILCINNEWLVRTVTGIPFEHTHQALWNGIFRQRCRTINNMDLYKFIRETTFRSGSGRCICVRNIRLVVECSLTKCIFFFYITHS